MSANGYLTPLPIPSPDTAPYWEGLRLGQFLVQRCRDCGKKRHYPRPVCDACYSLESEWVAIKVEGTLQSWTVCRHAFLPEFKEQLPYIVAIAEFEEGIRVNLRFEVPPDQALRTGDPVRIVYRQVSEQLTMPVLVLA